MDSINRSFCNAYADLENACLDLCGAAEDAVKTYADEMKTIMLLDPAEREGWKETAERLNALRRIWLYLTHTEGGADEAPACGEEDIRWMEGFTSAALGRRDPVSLYYRDRSEEINGSPEDVPAPEEEELLTALERLSGKKQEKRPDAGNRPLKPQKRVTGRGIRRGVLTGILCLAVLAGFAAIAWLLLR